MRQASPRFQRPASPVVRSNDLFADWVIAPGLDGARLMVLRRRDRAHRRFEAMARITHVSGGEGAGCVDTRGWLAATLRDDALTTAEVLCARVAGNAPHVWCAFDPAAVVSLQPAQQVLPGHGGNAHRRAARYSASRGSCAASHGFGLSSTPPRCAADAPPGARYAHTAAQSMMWRFPQRAAHVSVVVQRQSRGRGTAALQARLVTPNQHHYGAQRQPGARSATSAVCTTSVHQRRW